MTKIRLCLSLLLLSVAAAVWAVVPPFQPTTLANGKPVDGTRWYTMTIHSNKFQVSRQAASANYIGLSNRILNYGGRDLWCFVGNATSGYQIYNAAGGKLVAPTAMKGNTGDQSYAIVSSEVPAGYTDLWKFEQSSDLTSTTTTPVYIEQFGNNKALNNREGKLAFWDGGKDHGSTFLIEETDMKVLNFGTAFGRWTASNAQKTYHSRWSSTSTDPGFTLSAPRNDMYLVNGKPHLHLNTFTLTATQDWDITAYGMTFTGFSGTSSTRAAATVTPAGATAVSCTASNSAEVHLAGLTSTPTFTVSAGAIEPADFYVVLHKALSRHPFVATTIVGNNFAEGTRWYTLKFKNTTLAAAAADGSIQLAPVSIGATTTSLPAQPDNQLWCFVGSETQGYTIYNKALGTTKALVATAPATNGAEARVEVLAGNTKSHTWWFSSSTNLTSAYTEPVYMQLQNANGYALNLNEQTQNISFWTGGKDAGSTVLIEAAYNTQLSYALDGDHGTFYRDDKKTTGQNWNTYLISTQTDPVLTLANASNKNNIGFINTTTPKTVKLASSNFKDYTLSASEGYVITGYSFTFKGENGSAAVKDITTSKTATATAATAENFSVTGLNLQTVPFQVTSGMALIQNLRITVVPASVEADKQLTATNAKYKTALVFDNTKSGPGYRIPALGQAADGKLFVAVDLRRTGADIGMGNGHNDVIMKTSSDGGQTWDAHFQTIAAGDQSQPNSSKKWNYSFGDPSIVVDRNNAQNVLVMCVGGHTSFFDGQYNEPQHVVRLRSTNGGQTWTADSLTYQIYNLTKDGAGGVTNSLFLTSGKIMQSRYIKQGDYYRLYIAYPTNNTRQNATFVIYSDDFGATWKLLGSKAQLPSTGADESKVEELPDGSVLVSVRNRGSLSRGFSLFTYTDIAKGEGNWDFQTNATAMNNAVNNVNGEILIVPARRVSDNKQLFVALQSITLSTRREKVGVYFKELATYSDYSTAAALANGWTKGMQVSNIGSCYTGMELLNNGTIGYIYEEDARGGLGGYNILFKQIPLEDLTNGQYVLDRTSSRAPYVKQAAEALRARMTGMQSSNGNYVGMVKPESVVSLATKVSAAETAATTAEATPNETNAFAAQQKIATAYDALYNKVEKIELQDGGWYRLTNKLKSTAALATDGTNLTQASTTGAATNLNLLFQFRKTADGAWLVKNGNYQVFVKPTPAVYTAAPVTANEAEAGKYKVVSTIEGLSYLQCLNPTDGGKPAIHADNSGSIVAWTTSSDASLWYIEPVTTWTLSSTRPDGENQAYATAYMPFAYTLEGTDAVANLVTLGADNRTVKLEACNGTVPEGTGVLLLNHNLGQLNMTLNIAPKADPLTKENALQGTYLRKNLSANDYEKFYVLSIHPTKKVAGFYYVRPTAPEATGTATKAILAANKAYLPVSNASGVRKFLPISSDETTGISNAAISTDLAPQIFDLQGRHISQKALQKGGVYIVNGKKVVF